MLRDNAHEFLINAQKQSYFYLNNPLKWPLPNQPAGALSEKRQSDTPLTQYQTSFYKLTKKKAELNSASCTLHNITLLRTRVCLRLLARLALRSTQFTQFIAISRLRHRCVLRYWLRSGFVRRTTC